MEQSEDKKKHSGYKYVGQNCKLMTVMLRYAILAKIIGVKIPDDVEIKTLDEVAANTYKSDRHTNVSDSLIFLYGAGVLEKNALDILLKSAADIYDDVNAAEGKIIEDLTKDEDERMSFDLIARMLVCAACTKQYDNVESLSFKEIEELAALNFVEIKNGFVRLTDAELIEFLFNLGEEFGVIDKKIGAVAEKCADNVVGSEYVANGEIDEEGYPFMFRPLKLIYYSKVYNKVYGKSFIEYAKENNISFDDNYEAEYEKFVKQKKLHFEVRSYSRRRHICGNKVNWFDYALSVDGFITDNLKENTKLKVFNLDVTKDYNDEELLKKARESYTRTYSLEEDAVLEIYHDAKEYLYVMRSDSLQPVDSKEFHTMLFDFDKIWGIILMCSRSGQLKKQGDNIVIPQEIWNEIEPSQRCYASNLIKEQYKKMVEHRKNNKLLQSLSELKAEAERANKEKQKLAKLQQDKTQDLNEKKANRGNSTEDKK